MKRIIASCLCALLLCGTVSAAAAAEEPAPPETACIAWEDLEQRIRAGSLNAQILEENIGSIEAIDYERMYEELRENLNEIASAQWMMITMGAYEEAEKMDSAYDSLRETFDAIKDGELQEDNADAIWQLESSINRVTMAGETLYINLLSMEQSAQDAQRGLDALDRSLAELRLRQTLGQVSEQDVADLEQKRADTVSQLDALQHTITTYKMQLQLLIGEEPTGELTLGPLPDITAEDIAALDYEADLETAKEASWDLYDAKLTYQDAQEDWWSDQFKRGYKGEIAQHTWNAAQASYQSTVQDFETSFQNLYRSLSELQRVWENKQNNISYQEKQLTIAQAQYDWGRISYAALLTAQDNVENARSEAETARLELFDAWNQYQVAVKTGVLN